MPEINIDIEYFDHRKTKRLILRFGEDAAIYPIKIWSYAARHHPIDGCFSGYSDDEIAAILSASSNATSILQALLDVGFLERTAAGIVVHGWVERQGHIVAYHERAVNAANKRWAKLRQNEGKDATSIAKSGDKHATSNALQEATQVTQGSNSIEGKGVQGKNHYAEDSDPYRAACFLQKRILEWDASVKITPAKLQGWAREADLMHRVDNRSWEDFKALLWWIDSQKAKPSRSGFSWAKVIRSMGSIREKWNDGKFSEFAEWLAKGET